MSWHLIRCALGALVAVCLVASQACATKRGVNYGGIYYDEESAGPDHPDDVVEEQGSDGDEQGETRPRRSCDTPCQSEREACYLEATAEHDMTICQSRYDECVKDCGGG